MKPICATIDFDAGPIFLVGDLVRVPVDAGFCFARVEKIDGPLVMARAEDPYIGDFWMPVYNLELVRESEQQIARRLREEARSVA